MSFALLLTVVIVTAAEDQPRNTRPDPSLLSPTVDQSVRYAVDVKGPSISDNPIRCLLKPHREGGYVLLTVNLDDAVLNVTYTLPAGLTVERLLENRPTVERGDDGKTFSDRYEPFDVHVYRVGTAQQ